MLKILILAITLFSKAVPASQTLPSLKADPRIQKGTLASGVTYYMVTNTSAKGYAHIAVVQRDEPLTSSPLGVDDPAFFARMGVAPGNDGYVTDVDGSTVFLFRDVPFYRKDLADSMLLYSFSQVAASRSQQAVIVSGDIDPAEIKKKMDIFSMMVPKMLVKENHKPDYVWESSPAPRVETRDPYAPVADVSVTYATARVPYEYMNTVQAIVTDLFGAEFQAVVKHRLESNLEAAAIPFGEVTISALRSTDYGGDERYTVKVTIPRTRHDAAMRVIASTLGELDSWGATPGEFTDAKKVIAPRLSARAASLPSNGDDVRRCIGNFLYGANLAPAGETLRYFTRKNVADTTETRFFNQFSDALLGQLENLTLEFTGAPDSLDKDDALFYYNLSYLLGSVNLDRKDYSWRSADTLALDYNGPRVKVKSEKAETMSGGVTWTFSNGMKVVLKPVTGSGMFSYALHLGGGLPLIPGLREGEGGYIGDMLSLYNVAGIPARSFRDILAAEGISMGAAVDVSGMTIGGNAPSRSLEFLLKSLVALSRSGKVDAAEFEKYRAACSLVPPSAEDLLFQRLVPGFVYTANKISGQLGADTPSKAQKYFDDRFCRMQDGILVISGDLDTEAVKKLLGRYLGGFATDKASLPRKNVQMNTLKGTVTSQIDDYPTGVYVLMDADCALTSENYYTAQIAAMALKKALTVVLAPCGYTSEVVPNHFAQPQERFQLMITCFPVSREGLPEGMSPALPADALNAVRNAVKTASSSPVSQADLAAWKEFVKERAGREISSPEGCVKALEERYSANKDITSRYAENIQAISADKVLSFLKAMAGGGRIEYTAK